MPKKEKRGRKVENWTLFLEKSGWIFFRGFILRGSSFFSAKKVQKKCLVFYFSTSFLPRGITQLFLLIRLQKKEHFCPLFVFFILFFFNFVCFVCFNYLMYSRTCVPWPWYFSRGYICYIIW